MTKKICDVCKGNGFVRVPYEQSREEQLFFLQEPR